MRHWMTVILLGGSLLPIFSAHTNVPQPHVQDKDVIYKLKIVQPYKQTIPHSVTLPKFTEEVKLITDLGLIFINAYINGKGPFVFWLDTGSEITLISNKIVKELELPLVAKIEKHIQASHSKKKMDSHLAIADKINIGDATFHKAPIFTLDEKHKAFELLKNLDVVGIIGMNMFYDVTLTLDIAHNKFYMQKNFTPETNAIKLTGLYFSPVIYVKIKNRGKTKQYPFLVDSGFNGGIEMPDCNTNTNDNTRISHSLDFFSKVEKGFYHNIQGKLSIGQLDYRNPEVRYVPSNCKKKKPFGLLGTKFLKDKLVSINLRKRLLSIIQN
tara:strand:+ start:19555 stop:20532 length:978 start_codon:yes stop_codon:yes gene_type:complete